MPLLIAVVLGVILFSINRCDKARKAESKKITDEEWGKREAFRNSLTDTLIENQVRVFIENPENNEYVNQETAKALSEMHYQKRSYRNLTVQDKLDILLANRGKVSSRGAELGYWIGYLKSGKGKNTGYSRDFITELEQYGFVLWLQEALRKYNPELEIVVMETSAGNPFGYAWRGSPYERQFSLKHEIKVPLIQYKPSSAKSI